MKVTISDKKVTPFGGFNFCYKFLKDIGIPKLMDDHLGSRVNYRGFDYSEILMNHLAIFLHGGDCTEDIQEHLGEHLKKVRGFSVCSADTILRRHKRTGHPYRSNDQFGWDNPSVQYQPRLKPIITESLEQNQSA